MAKAGIRAELQEFKRDRILEEVLDLFYERGFHGTTLDALAERLQVTKPFIYQFFRSKEDLLVALYERGARRILALINDIQRGDLQPLEQLRSFVVDFARQNIESQAISAVFLQEEKNLPKQSLRMIRKMQREFDDRLSDLIQRGVDCGEFTVKEPRLAALAIAGMVRWIHRWYRPGGRLSVNEIADHFAEMALTMVMAAPVSSRQEDPPNS